MEFLKDGLFTKSAASDVKIFQALVNLLKTEEFDDVTVKQIYKTAHVGKTTFYSHYQDKYDIIQQFTSIFFDLGVAQIGRTLTWQQGHTVSTTGYLQFCDILRKAFLSKDYNGLQLYSPRRREENIIETLSKYKKVEIDKLLHAQIVSLATGETALFSQYIIKEKSPKINEFVQALMCIVPQQLYELLKEPAISKKDSINEELMRVNLIAQALSMPVQSQNSNVCLA